MVLINEVNQETKNYYSPNHCVLKTDLLITKVRVVFDESCKTSLGTSLNDKLMVGPKIQEDIFNILLRFRKNKVAFTADIEKMYRQVNVHSDDCKFQRIVWREDSSQNLNHYELKTVTYGLGPSSFLATRCLSQLSFENEVNSLKASQIIKRDFYMDDLISGADNLENATVLLAEIIKILNSGKLPLRQWVSNDPQLLQNFGIQSDCS